MASNYKYNGETDFLKFYKDLYGKDYNESEGFSTDGLTQGQADVGSILYRYYTQGKNDAKEKNENINTINKTYDTQAKTVNDTYAASIAALDKYKQAAQQKASIAYQKMNKYLPMQQAAQGLSGAGLGSSAQLKAYNTYMNSLGNITKDYSDKSSDLDMQKKTALSDIETKRASELKANDTLFDGYLKARQDAAGTEASGAWSNYLTAQKNDRETNYNNAWDALTGSAYTTNAEIDSVIGNFGDMSEEQKKSLLEYGYGIAAKNKTAADEKARAEAEESHNEAFASLKSAIANQTFATSDDAAKYVSETLLGTDSGITLTAAEIDELNALAAARYNETSTAAANDLYERLRNAIAGSSTRDLTTLETFINDNATGLSDSQKNTLKQEASNIVDKNVKADADLARTDAYNYAQELIYAGNTETAQTFMESNKSTLGDSTYNQLLGMINNPIVTDSEGNIVAEEKTVEPVTMEASVKSGLDLNTSGNNFTIKLGDNDYKVRTGKQIKDGDVFDVAGDYEDGTIFGYDGTLYVKFKGVVREIEARYLQRNKADNDYLKLLKIYFPKPVK